MFTSFALLTLLQVPAFAAPAVAWPTEDQWAPLTRGGEPIVDGAGDAGSTYSNTALDIVGEPGSPAGLWYTDGDGFFFRMRVDQDPNELDRSWKGEWGILFTTDEEKDSFDYGLVVDSLTSSARSVLITKNTDPTGGVSERAEDIILTMDDTAALFRSAEAESTVSSTTDWYLDFRLTLADATFIDATSILSVILVTDGLDAQAFDVDMSSSKSMSSVADGLSDPISIDQDADGLTWFEEQECGSDPTEADIDGDGLTDLEECGTELDPNDADSDDDGVSDADEYPCRGLYTAATATDRDNDGVPDSVEGTADTDGDGLLDFCDADADGDGRVDAVEGEGDDDCDGITNRLDRDDADGSCEAGDSGEPPDLGSDTSDTGAKGGSSRCGCASGPGVGLAWLPLVALLTARRRKSSLTLAPCHGISAR